MKSFVIALTTAIALFTSAHAFAAERTVKLQFQGMLFGCGYIVMETLAGVEGVRKVEVAYAQETAVVAFEDTTTDVATLRAATSKVGYPFTVIE